MPDRTCNPPGRRPIAVLLALALVLSAGAVIAAPGDPVPAAVDGPRGLSGWKAFVDRIVELVEGTPAAPEESEKPDGTSSLEGDEGPSTTPDG